MPTGSRREDTFIERFLSAYENGSWAGAQICWLDKWIDGAVDATATRRSDGKTLAIEHTIIEPFVNEKGDFACFEAAFLGIEDDKSLPVPGRRIQVFVPVGTLHNQRKQADTIVRSVHSWLKTNRLSIPNGNSKHLCLITGIPRKPASDITLTFKVVPLPGPGILLVRRQQVVTNLGDVIVTALGKKLPKLAKTPADKRILLLERQHMNLSAKSMLDEIEKRQGSFPDLAAIHEIWIMETMAYEDDSDDSYLRFELYENGTEITSYDFQGANLCMKLENGMEVIVQESP